MCGWCQVYMYPGTLRYIGGLSRRGPGGSSFPVPWKKLITCDCFIKGPKQISGIKIRLSFGFLTDTVMSSPLQLRKNTTRPARMSTLSATGNTHHLPLILRLPCELRLQIFEYAYGNFILRTVVEVTSANLGQVLSPVGEPSASERLRSGLTMCASIQRRASTRRLPPEQSANACLGIPLTCKVFAREALPILYRRTLFHVNVMPDVDYFNRKGPVKSRRLVNGAFLRSMEKYRVNLHMDEEADVAAVLKNLRSLVATMQSSGRPVPSSMCFPLCSHSDMFEPGNADDLLGVFLPSSLSLPSLRIDDPVQHVFSKATVKASMSDPEGPYLFMMSEIEW
jgi:hypothetical protein